MDKSSKRFLWSLLGIILLFFTIQNVEAVKTGLGMLLELVLPLLYGCAIAFVVNLLVRWMEKFLTFGIFRKQKFRRVVSITASFLLLTAILSGVVAGLVPEIRASVAMLGEKLPRLIAQTVEFCVEYLDMPQSWFDGILDMDIGAVLETVLQNDLVQQVLSSGGNLVGGAVTSVLDFLIGLCFSFYILMQKEKLGQDIRRLCSAYLKPEANARLLRLVTVMDEIYSSFISGQCLDAMILGVMVAVVLAVFGIDYALLIGILVAVTALVPVVGAFLGGAIGVFLLLMVSVKDAAIFLVAFLVLQQIDNRLIYPHVVGNAVGLPAIWIFAAIVIGGNFGGIFGMLLAIPLFALAYTLLAQDLRKRETQKQSENLPENQ